MDATRFAHWTRSLSERVKRRAITRLAAGVLSAFGAVTITEPEESGAVGRRRHDRRRQEIGRRANVSAEKKKKKKKKCAAGLATCKVKKGKKKKTLCVDALTDAANCGGCGVTCPGGQSCIAGSCTGAAPAQRCDASTCPNGCCDGTTCHAGNTRQACGLGGATCHSCAEGEVCRDGACIACALTVQPGDDLQQAINSAPVGGTVCLRAGTYSISTALKINTNVRLRGEGAETTKLLSDGSDCIATIGQNVTPPSVIDVRFRGITMAGAGHHAQPSPAGCVVAYRADVDFDDCVLENNASGSGGAVSMRLGGVETTLSMRNCVVSNNHAIDVLGGLGGHGGAIFLRSHTVATFERCTFTGNIADGRGGAIDAFDNTIDEEEITTIVILRNCDFDLNQAEVCGALFLSLGDLLVEDSTFTRNSATRDGGAFLMGGSGNSKAAYLLRNVTISDNSAQRGGGIFYVAGERVAPLTLTNCTVSNNDAVMAGGGIFVSGEPAPVTLTSTNITNNSPDNCAGAAIAGCTN